MSLEPKWRGNITVKVLSSKSRRFPVAYEHVHTFLGKEEVFSFRPWHPFYFNPRAKKSESCRVSFALMHQDGWSLLFTCRSREKLWWSAGDLQHKVSFHLSWQLNTWQHSLEEPQKKCLREQREEVDAQRRSSSCLTVALVVSVHCCFNGGGGKEQWGKNNRVSVSVVVSRIQDEYIPTNRYLVMQLSHKTAKLTA